MATKTIRGARPSKRVKAVAAATTGPKKKASPATAPRTKSLTNSPTPTKAKTIILIHGLANKPPEDVLKCQWDRALFGFELGERSRLAYWVNRERYPKAQEATCESGDLIDVGEPPASEKGILAVGLPKPPTLEEEVEALAETEAQREVLLALAERLDRGESLSRETESKARSIEAKVLPLPGFLRRWITRQTTKLFLRDAHDLFFNEEQRELMRESLRERLRPGGGPFVLIAHSQGSMIAYDVLSRLDPAEFDIALFITIGSPLALTEVKDQIKILTGQKKLLVPRCVRRWINVADRLDPVALDANLAKEYAPRDGVKVEDVRVKNPDGPKHAHSGTGYLSTDVVRRAVRETVDLGLFQPVSRFVIARDVSKAIERAPSASRHEVLIELSEVGDGPSDLDALRQTIVEQIRSVSLETPERETELHIEELKRFVAARLTREEIETLASRHSGTGKALRRIWKNAEKRALIEASTNTLQVRPAHQAYHAFGQGIGWAVLDTGVNAAHPHFALHENIATQWDCTQRGKLVPGGTANDGNGHGTHVAGIIAGSLEVGKKAPRTLAGMAPKSKLHVYKVLDDDGSGRDAWIIKALDHIAEVNERSSGLAIQGINLSLGGSFEVDVYACGHSPLCRELRRLWRQGVVVVIAAGNEGFAVLSGEHGAIPANMGLSIGDPGNLEESIVVGSVHKENPHTYGTSYFSSRGPTADGRQKPDLVAPGERILSCRHEILGGKEKSVEDLYIELSGTSMAAPHVSGLVASFLSLHREFIGYPDRVKEILLSSCTDLRRERNVQGAGMPNLVKMLVSV